MGTHFCHFRTFFAIFVILSLHSFDLLHLSFVAQQFAADCRIVADILLIRSAASPGVVASIPFVVDMLRTC